MTVQSSITSLAFNASARLRSRRARLFSDNSATLTAAARSACGSGATISGTKTRGHEPEHSSGADQIWTGVRSRRQFKASSIIDDAIADHAYGKATSNANVQWTALTDLRSTAVRNINATGKGCTPPSAGPRRVRANTRRTSGTQNDRADTENLVEFHEARATAGRAAGARRIATASATYGFRRGPVLYGSAAGKTGRSPGRSRTGGGTIRNQRDRHADRERVHRRGRDRGEGNFTGDQNYAGGGGSGGSVSYRTLDRREHGAITKQGRERRREHRRERQGRRRGGGRISITYTNNTTSGSFLMDDVPIRSAVAARRSRIGRNGDERGVAGTAGTLTIILLGNPVPTRRDYAEHRSSRAMRVHNHRGRHELHRVVRRGDSRAPTRDDLRERDPAYGRDPHGRPPTAGT